MSVEFGDMRTAYGNALTELVNKWIDLHVIGKKKDELQQIAMELGYQ